MKKSFGQSDPAIIEYSEKLLKPEIPELEEIRARAQEAGLPSIHVGDFDGLHLEILARVAGARKIVEIGTLAGYSGVRLCRALPPDGRLYTFEYEPRHAEVARETFRKLGFSDRVDLRVGPARENLPQIEEQGPFDLVFIDADKVSYPHYLNWASTNLRMGGTLIADNTFGWGYIAASPREVPIEDRESMAALQEFNRRLAADPRFRTTMIPTGEGLTVAVRVG